jgi:photosystem II stability/assembly factor-like uncharacterized protein
MLKNALKRPIVMCLFSCLVLFGIVACSAGNTGGVGSTPTATTTPTTKPTIQLTSIRMLNENNGWAFTRQSILLTTDGGLHWRDVSPANLSGIVGNQGVRAGAFFNASMAWVSLNTKDSTIQILRTSDSGQHWDTTTLQGNGFPDRVHFVNAQDGWIEIDRGGAAGSEAVDIYQTTNGGQTWNKVSDTGPTPGSLPFNGHKTGISFKDTTTGWATGDIARPDFVWLYVTHDGGKTWQHQDLALPPGIANPTMTTTTPPVFFGNIGFLPVLIAANTGRLEVLYVTHDGGTTWKSTTPLHIAPGSIFSLTSSVYVFDVNQSWTWPDQWNTSYSTGDGGQHWTTYTSSIQNGVSGMSFISRTTGWAIGNSPTNEPLLFKTTDGGQTWSKVDYSIE